MMLFISLYLMCSSVNGTGCLVCCVFDIVCELFGETIRHMLGVVAILLLNVKELFTVVGGALLYGLPKSVCVVSVIPVCVQILLPYVCLCFCMSEVISSFKSLRAESHVFAFLKLFLCVILHIMWSGKSLQLLCILHFGMLCLSAISMMFVKIMLAMCMLVGMVV